MWARLLAVGLCVLLLLPSGQAAELNLLEEVRYFFLENSRSKKGPENRQAAMHEYTHLIVEHMGLKLPVWLNEGLADFYSSLEPKGAGASGATVGRDGWACC